MTCSLGFILQYQWVATAPDTVRDLVLVLFFSLRHLATFILLIFSKQTSDTWDLETAGYQYLLEQNQDMMELDCWQFVNTLATKSTV